MIVMKFGGSSVANRAQIEKVLGIVRDRVSAQPLVVSSAHKGITDGLIAAARAAVERKEAPGEAVIAKQAAVGKDCGCPEALLAPFFEELRSLLKGISLVGELSPRSLDYVSSFGERMAVRVIADFFTRSGLKAQAFDVWDLGFVTDANFGQARPLAGYEEVMKREVAAKVPAGTVAVVTGFVGKTPKGDVTTVGRNGSDLTCTLVAAAVGAAEAQIWSDTDGVMTADPSVVPAAKNIPRMRFDEAAELAYFGSRVLHPATLEPAMARNIPVRVLNTNRPSHPGTVIEAAPPAAQTAATSIAYKEGQTVVTLRSTRMFGESGFLSKVFEVLGRKGVVVDMVATSEVTVSFTTDRPAVLEAALPELRAFGEVAVAGGKTLLTVVGQQLARRAGLGARILGAVASVGVNVEMISYGEASINWTMLIADADIGRAVPVLHQMLFDAP